MIFIHLLIGVILGFFFNNSFFFILGSIFPDLDHIYIIIKNRFFSINKIIETIKLEEKFKVRYKTPFFHSLFGMVLFSLVLFLINKKASTYFFIAYFIHLLVDWFDIDEKYYLYPFKIKFNGFLPIFSRFEKILTLGLFVIIILLYG